MMIPLCRTISLRVHIGLALALTIVLPARLPAADGPGTPWRPLSAAYVPLMAQRDLDTAITLVALSTDGHRAYVAGWSQARRKASLFVVDTVTGGVQRFSLPDLDHAPIVALETSTNGSRAFFVATRPGLPDRLYRAEGLEATLIVDGATQSPPLANIREIRVRGDGTVVFFREQQGYGGDVWRVEHDGSAARVVIDDVTVRRDDLHGGQGFLIKEFAVSTAGDRIAFILQGEFDPGNIHVRHDKPEVFLWSAGQVRQLSDDDPPSHKYFVHMSGDGGTIVYQASGSDRRWVAVRGAAHEVSDLGPAGIAFQGADLDEAGRLLFVEDGATNGGRVLATDGSWRADLFPRGRSGAVKLAVTRPSGISCSSDGELLAFASLERLYVGHVGATARAVDRPVVRGIAVEPWAPSKLDPNARWRVTADVHHPGGPNEIVWVGVEDIIRGCRERDWSKRVIVFAQDPVDDGTAGDAVAGDGVFSAIGRIGGAAEGVVPLAVRVSVLDKSGAVMFDEYPRGARDTIVDVDTAWVLSPDQQRVVDEQGYPDAFTMVTASNAPEDPSTVHRLENWKYYGSRQVHVFVDGASSGVRALETSGPVARSLSGYRPDQFLHGMTWQDVHGIVADLPANSCGDGDYDTVVLKGIELGFEGGRLVYVDTSVDQPADDIGSGI